MLNRYEWKDKIDFIVNPKDPYYLSFFTQPWNREMVEKLYPKRSTSNEIIKVIKALNYLYKQKLHQKLSKHPVPLTLVEYMELQKS